MKDLLEIAKDKNEDDETRSKAAVCYCLLLFAERIDENTVRITSDTMARLGTYIKIMKLAEEVTNES